ncbi:MAG: hypothetical protein GYB68_06060 [Chloroflexi bacterium]|nr:hypothetical protein [Chloroflexota bacterium]
MSLVMNAVIVVPCTAVLGITLFAASLDSAESLLPATGGIAALVAILCVVAIGFLLLNSIMAALGGLIFAFLRMPSKSASVG